MGEYVYKVTAKTKILSDGRKANIAVFAYKPTRSFYSYNGESAEKINRRSAKFSGCPQAERFVETSKNYTGFVVLGEDGEHAVPVSFGTFTDSWFCEQVRKDV